jgi:hypothetical protein
MAEVAGSIPVGPTNTPLSKLIHQDFFSVAQWSYQGSRSRPETFRSVDYGS